MSFLGRTE